MDALLKQIRELEDAKRRAEMEVGALKSSLHSLENTISQERQAKADEANRSKELLRVNATQQAVAESMRKELDNLKDDIAGKHKLLDSATSEKKGLQAKLEADQLLFASKAKNLTKTLLANTAHFVKTFKAHNLAEKELVFETCDPLPTSPQGALAGASSESTGLADALSKERATVQSTQDKAVELEQELRTLRDAFVACSLERLKFKAQTAVFLTAHKLCGEGCDARCALEASQAGAKLAHIESCVEAKVLTVRTSLEQDGGEAETGMEPASTGATPGGLRLSSSALIGLFASVEQEVISAVINVQGEIHAHVAAQRSQIRIAAAGGLTSPGRGEARPTEDIVPVDAGAAGAGPTEPPTPARGAIHGAPEMDVEEEGIEGSAVEPSAAAAAASAAQ